VVNVLVMAPEVRAWLHDLRKRDRVSAIPGRPGHRHAARSRAGAGPPTRRPHPALPADQPEGTTARLRRAKRDPHPVHLRSRRNAVLLVAGDKAGKWEAWYRQAIPLAEQRYEEYLKQEGIR
jgi:hypothetical protein